MNIQELASLFHIHEKASAHGSLFPHIRDEAMRLLKEHNAELAPEPTTAPQSVADENQDIEPVKPVEDDPSGVDNDKAEGIDRRGIS